MRELTKKITAIIPVFGREDVFSSITALRQFRKEFRLSFVVVDNGNGSELSAKLAELAGEDCRVIRLNRNLGGSGAFRAGMQAVLAEPTADLVWLLDDDALVNEATLPGLVQEWERLSGEGVRVGAVGSAMFGRMSPEKLIEVGSRISRLTGKVYPYRAGERLDALGSMTMEVDYVAAASLLTSVSVLREVGIFENVFIHYDDIEWSLRLREAGYRIFATTKSSVNHLEGVAKKADWLFYYDTRNRFWCLRLHMPVVYRVALVKRYIRLLLHLLLGHWHIARLIRLGLRHSKTGELLLRDELP